MAKTNRNYANAIKAEHIRGLAAPNAKTPPRGSIPRAASSKKVLGRRFRVQLLPSRPIGLAPIWTAEPRWMAATF